MKPLDDFEIYDRSIYLTESDTLVMSDIHIGLEEAVRDEGLSMPLGEKERITSRVQGNLDKFEPSTVVFNGDVHHSFGKLGEVPDTLHDLISLIGSYDSDAVFIEGNHDTMLDSLVDTKSWVELSDAVCTHGDRIPVDLPDSELYIIGHDHPCIEVQMEKKECFLIGEWRDSGLVMMPAFNSLCLGTAVNKMDADDFMSPFIEGDFGDFHVVLEKEKGELLEFPSISQFRGML